PKLCGSAIGRFDITGPGYPMETTSYLHSLTAFRTPDTICWAVIVGPDASLQGSFCPVASILTCVPPTSTTSTFILKPGHFPPAFNVGLMSVAHLDSITAIRSFHDLLNDLAPSS